MLSESECMNILHDGRSNASSEPLLLNRREMVFAGVLAAVGGLGLAGCGDTADPSGSW